MTGGQPYNHKMISGKMSVLPLRVQTGDAQTSAWRECWKRESDPFRWKQKSWRAQAVPTAQEIELHPVPVGQPERSEKYKWQHLVAKIKIQAKPPSAVRKQRKCSKDPRVKDKGNQVWGLLSQARGRGAWRRCRSLIRRPRPWKWKGQSLCGSGVSGADQMSDADRDYVENALKRADDRLHDAVD